MSAGISGDFLNEEKPAEEYTREITKLNLYVNALLDSAFSYALLLDRNGKILYYSDSLLALSGVSDGSAFIGVTIIEACETLNNAISIQDVGRRFSRILSGESYFFEDDTVTWPSGERRIYRIHYRRIAGENNELDAILIYSHDITDLRLEEAERRISELLGSTILPCLVWNEKGEIIAYNNVIADIFGAPRDLPPESFNELIKSIQPKFQPDGIETEVVWRNFINETLRVGLSHTTVRLEKYDGTPIFFEVNATRVSWLFGYRLIVYYNDLTEIKANEQKMLEITERERKLEIQREAAHAANEAKSQFIANMSHEIRTPMNSIIGFTELAMDDAISPKTKEYLKKIMENSTGLLHILNDILDISKIESGRMEFENIPFDLQDVFNFCKTNVELKAAENNVTLLFSAQPLIGKKLIGDPTRLRQILLNLLSNAVKFTNNGTVKLVSVVKRLTGSSVIIRFEVSDSGIGMTPGQIKRIYEPFMQADSSMTRKYGGTGLGLPITENILQLLGSRLEVESAPNVGSMFRFELVFDTMDMSSEPLKQDNAGQMMGKPMFSGEILVCEDNRMNQRVISEHLKKIGLRVEIAENGEEGVEKVRNRIDKGEKPYDLIFMDIHMPVMDGLEAVSLIRQVDKKTYIIAMTADIKTHDNTFYKRAGMNGSVGKPFTSHELWRCLLKYLTPVGYNDTDQGWQGYDVDMLQKKLRTDFVKDNQTIYGDIVVAIDAGDIKLAHRLAHSLKSNAGMIGKTDLQNAASDVEKVFRNGENKVSQSQLCTVEVELNKVLAELSPMLSPKNTSDAEVLEFDAGSVQEILEELEPLVESGNTECLKFIDTISALPGSGKLIKQLEDFDFKLAAETLAKLKICLEVRR